MSVEKIYLDIETIPTQNQGHIKAMQAAIKESFESKAKALLEERANVQPPGNVKDPEKIAEAIAKKQRAIDEQIDALNHEASQAFEDAYRKTSLDGGFGEAVVCSIAVDDDEPFALVNRNWDKPGGEVSLLQTINQALDRICGRQMGQVLVGHNIIGFDRKFLRQRGIVRGIRMHHLLTKEVKPWDKDIVIDTMTLWTGDVRDRISMNKLCQVLGLPGKGDDIDGSVVWDFVASGQIDKVAEYCNDDVRRTRNLYKRLMYLPVLESQPEPAQAGA